MRDRAATFDFFAAARPRYVVMAAAKVGGIMANSTYPADFLSDNLRIQVNVLDAALSVGVERLLFLGSSCIYPKLAPQPISEDALLTGPLEPTNDAYAIAKIAGVMQVQAMRRQHGVRWVSAMPTNLYGPGDNFDPQLSHVLPAMIRRFHEAKVGGAPTVSLWGTGTPRREFLHVDDLARACELVLDRYDDPAPINIGVGHDVTIRELAEIVAGVVGYTRRAAVRHRANPTARRASCSTCAASTRSDSRRRIGLAEGIASTYDWYVKHADSVGVVA